MSEWSSAVSKRGYLIGFRLGGRMACLRDRAAAAAALCLALSPAAVQAEPANTLHDMWDRLQTCLSAAHGSDELANGSEITILFTLRRDGSQLGRPRITHSDLRGDLDDQKKFVANVVSAIDGCLPLDITPGLGGAIAGRPIALRVIKGRWQFGA